MKQFDYLVFIGRFQPFHLGHQFVIQKALTYAKKVILLIGSVNSPRTLNNPFSFDERQQIIHNIFKDDVICLPIADVPYDDDSWVFFVKQAVNSVSLENDKIGLIGHTKDDSSYYLTLFPKWHYVELPNFNNLSATPIRMAYIKDGTIDTHNLPSASVNFLQKFRHTTAYTQLQNAYLHIKELQDAWQNAPYPPIFVTADAVVLCQNHLLVIRRSGAYGQGAIALAGGFIDQSETWLDACVREVQEETTLVLDKKTLIDSQIFDDPKRSLRGRTITQAFLFVLDYPNLPSLHACDDADKAFWLPLDDIYKIAFFEDHLGIIVRLLKDNGLI